MLNNRDAGAIRRLSRSLIWSITPGLHQARGASTKAETNRSIPRRIEDALERIRWELDRSIGWSGNDLVNVRRVQARLEGAVPHSRIAHRRSGASATAGRGATSSSTTSTKPSKPPDCRRGDSQENVGPPKALSSQGSSIISSSETVGVAESDLPRGRRPVLYRTTSRAYGVSRPDSARMRGHRRPPQELARLARARG